MENILEAYLEVAPFLKDIMQEDISIAISDTTTFLYYRPGDTINLKIIAGDKITVEDPLYKCITEGIMGNMIIPKEIHGFTFRGIGYPIRDSHGNIVGAIALGKSLAEQVKVEEAADNLFSSLEENSASAQEICTGSQNLLVLINNIVENTKKTEEQIKRSNDIIGMIQNMATQSNLLGLNAAIEAARSGEHGRGFSVVASEMRKLAQLSSESSKNVSNSISEINKSMEEILKLVNQAMIVSEGQAASTEEITATLEEITANAQTLLEVARIK